MGLHSPTELLLDFRQTWGRKSTSLYLRLCASHVNAVQLVNDLKTYMHSPNIIASCSDDYTVRMWDLNAPDENKACVAMLAGGGHRAEIKKIVCSLKNTIYPSMLTTRAGFPSKWSIFAFGRSR